MDKKQNQSEELINLEEIEIQPLTEDELDSVAGGLCSISRCSNGTVDPENQVS